MPEVTFHEIADVDDVLLKFAVIVARHGGEWVWCRNKTRGANSSTGTWELPGGQREDGETILDTAKRELFEETGSVMFELTPICAYKINSYGMLYFAEITEFGEMPNSEIDCIGLFDEMPGELSFPLFHPKHFAKVRQVLGL